MHREIPENIPRNLIKEIKFWRSDGGHEYNQLNLHPRVYPGDIPYNFAAKVCYRRGEGHEGVTFHKGIPVCDTCRKPFIWFLHYCMLCGNLFIRDFGDPRYCDLYPTCWNCLPNLEWDTCPDHISLYRGDNRTANLGPGYRPFPPVGLNPKTFTDEDLEDAFDF